MRLASVLFITLLGFAVAVPVKENDVTSLTDVSRNSVLESLLLNLLESLRELMINGSEDIPVLDPLELDHIHVNDIFGLERSHVTANNIVGRNLSTFVVDKLNLTMTNFVIIRTDYTLDLEAHIPSVEVEAEYYDLSVTALGLTIFGTGDFTIKVIEPRVNAQVNLTIGLLGARIQSADVHVSLAAFEPQFTGVFLDEILNDFINLFLAALIPDIMDFYQVEINSLISEAVVTIGNQILENINIGDLLPMASKALKTTLPNEEEFMAMLKADSHQ